MRDLIETLQGIAEWIERMPIPTKGATAKLIKIDQAIGRAEAAVAKARKESSLRKDAMRFRWISGRPLDEGLSWDSAGGQVVLYVGGQKGIVAPTLAEAIDAAMARQQDSDKGCQRTAESNT